GPIRLPITSSPVLGYGRDLAEVCASQSVRTRRRGRRRRWPRRFHTRRDERRDRGASWCARILPQSFTTALARIARRFRVMIDPAGLGRHAETVYCTTTT